MGELVKTLKEKGVKSGPEFDGALAEMKRLKEVCGEVELSKSERKKLEKAQKEAQKAQASAPASQPDTGLGNPADRAELEKVKEQVRELKSQGQGGEALDAALAHLKKL